MLKTAHKIFLARAAYLGIMLVRRLFGRGPEVEVTRGGLRWQLDLREGIDFSIFLLGGFEPATLRLYEELVRPGDVVLDIGANVGAHTLPLAMIVGEGGKVHAFEPTSFAFGKLKSNISLNPVLALRIHAHQCMLMADGELPIVPAVFSSWPLTGEQGLHEQHRGKLMSTEGATRKSLDQVLSELGVDRVDFIKLDVDGHEFDVVSGGRRSLERLRPKILMELAPYLFEESSGEFERLIDCLHQLGYTLTEVNSGRRLAMDAGALRSRIPQGASVNVIARPS